MATKAIPQEELILHIQIGILLVEISVTNTIPLQPTQEEIPPLLLTNHILSQPLPLILHKEMGLLLTSAQFQEVFKLC